MARADDGNSNLTSGKITGGRSMSPERNGPLKK